MPSPPKTAGRRPDTGPDGGQAGRSRVVLATLADHAVAQPDGRIHAMGAGLSRVAFPAFPGVLSQMAVALTLEVSEATDQPLQVRFMDSEGVPIASLFGFEFEAIPGAPQSGRTAIALVYTVQQLIFPRPGEYVVRVEEGGELLIELPIEAMGQVGDAPQAFRFRTLTQELQRGFMTFMAGELVPATNLFQHLVQRFPDSPDVHNNLGFCYLTMGRAAEANAEFAKAKESHYQFPEILMANQACAAFLLADYPSARDIFQGLLEARLKVMPVVMFGLGRDRATALTIGSPGDYLALMALNAARCCLRLGDKTSTRDLLGMAEVGRRTFASVSASRATFSLLIDEMTADVKSHHQ